MNRKKNCSALSALLSLLVAAVLLACMPTEAEADIYQDTLRLHILAASDTAEDQAIKLALRDKVLEKYGNLFAGADGIASAEEIARQKIDEIENDCDRWLGEMGCEYRAHAALSNEWYDTRQYEGFTLPKGRYASLRIVIGEGAGHNWWCVMYPPLCLDMATDAPRDDAGYSAAEKDLIGGKYQVKFKILEVFSELFAQNG